MGKIYRLSLSWIVFLVFLPLHLFGLAAPASQPAAPHETQVCNDLKNSETWTSGGSPYIVCSNPGVSVPYPFRLTIQPGVTVQFDPGGSLTIDGELVANGTAAEPIIFKGNLPNPGSWNTIFINGGGVLPAYGFFQHVLIQDGGIDIDGGQITVGRGELELYNSELKNGATNGVFISQNAIASVYRTHFEDHQMDAMRVRAQDTDLDFRDLTAANNGGNQVRIRQADFQGSRVWRDAGIPYLTDVNVNVNAGASLLLEPGVQIAFANNTRLDVAGRLESLGLASQPITLTAQFPVQGAWNGVWIVSLTNGPLALAHLEHTTVEYGGSGFNGGNLYLDRGKVLVRNSILRYGGNAGIYINNNSLGSTIEGSQIYGNAQYGLRNYSNAAAVQAANNWWASPTGPDDASNCNPSGTGQPIVGPAAFEPFLTSPQDSPPPPAATNLMSISISPSQTFAPANGSYRVYVRLTLHDGAGVPVPGRTLTLKSTLGQVTSGGTTDASGQTFAYITSATEGEAELTAELTGGGPCEAYRTALARLRFTPPAQGLGGPGSKAPYMNVDVTVDKTPITRGDPNNVSGTIENPTSDPVTVDVQLNGAASNIGMSFGPIGQLNGIVVPPNSSRRVSFPWTPQIAGDYCLRMDYSASGPGGTSSGYKQINLKSKAGPALGNSGKSAVTKASNATDAIGDAQWALGVMTDGAQVLPGGFIQDQLFTNILDFAYDNTAVIDCALKGGTDCGGWNGPKLQLPGDTFGNLSNDPPRDDYRTVSPPDSLSFTPLQPGANMPAARAAALNNLMQSTLDLTSRLLAATLAYDRYGGAAEAGERYYAALQASVYQFYLRQSGESFNAVADAVDQLKAAMLAEGIADILVQPADMAAYQARLASQGFSASELEAARMVGLPDATIEKIRQRRMQADPSESTGQTIQRWEALALAYRALGAELSNFSIFPDNSSPNTGFGLFDSALLVSPGNLVRLGTLSESFQVGNPLTQTAVIDLIVRPVDVPPDWQVEVNPRQVTLAPGDFITATLQLTPGAGMPQDTLVEVAVEGYAGSQLLGGIAVQVLAPEQVFYDGTWRSYLPVLLH